MAERITVTTRTDPDLDGVACAIAYAELLVARGEDAAALLPGRIDAEARYVLDHLGWARSAPAPTRRVVLVDASSRMAFPDALDPLDVEEVLDHRLPHRAGEEFPNARVQVERVGAAATLVGERFRAAGVQPGRAAAVLLAAAIQSNTQRLRGAVTEERDREMAAWLEAVAPLPAGLVEGQFEARRADALVDLAGALRRERKDFEHRLGAFGMSQLELPGAAALVDHPAFDRRALGPRGMVNLVDPVASVSVLVVPDPALRAWVAEAAGLAFEGDVAASRPARLRKQLVERLLRWGPDPG